MPSAPVSSSCSSGGYGVAVRLLAPVGVVDRPRRDRPVDVGAHRVPPADVGHRVAGPRAGGPPPTASRRRRARCAAARAAPRRGRGSTSRCRRCRARPAVAPVRNVDCTEQVTAGSTVPSGAWKPALGHRPQARHVREQPRRQPDDVEDEQRAVIDGDLRGSPSAGRGRRPARPRCRRPARPASSGPLLGGQHAPGVRLDVEVVAARPPARRAARARAARSTRHRGRAAAGPGRRAAARGSGSATARAAAAASASSQVVGGRAAAPSGSGAGSAARRTRRSTSAAATGSAASSAADTCTLTTGRPAARSRPTASAGSSQAQARWARSRQTPSRSVSTPDSSVGGLRRCSRRRSRARARTPPGPAGRSRPRAGQPARPARRGAAAAASDRAGVPRLAPGQRQRGDRAAGGVVGQQVGEHPGQVQRVRQPLPASVQSGW